MTDQLVCLTLVAARSLRQELFDYLSEQTDLTSGFTASEVAGHGPDVRLQTQAEQVKGHADELMVRIILAAQDATRLLERLNTAFAGSRMVYWIMPVSQFGVLDIPNR
ncbi:MAG TPA: DUF3240 family protein [Bradyrhizobium sp.]|uniref:DUF3240 family protein n=1 Tax=Bradyrhizobium sp. TaxID=376 RepID=UPI002D80BD63|nr:DUF3240 family protein [Bradyrhizobium sp.]HET7889845.1 DUF3240 family protein [Bradyrhizobium sp.]